MPDHKTHIFIAYAIVGAGLFLLNKFGSNLITFELNYVHYAIIALIVYLYSQLPDIDHDMSIINKIWNTAAGIVGFYSLYTGKNKLFGLIAIASIVIIEWVKHRGITHTIPFAIGMALPLFLISPLYGGIAIISVLIHLFLDGDYGQR